MGRKKASPSTVLGVSGGPDSVYLAAAVRENVARPVLAHFNHKARGKESDADQAFVEALGRALGIPVECGETVRARGDARPAELRGGRRAARFEEEAREERYAFLRETMRKTGADRILVAHTADDQVETVLMRVLEGAGISGLKGIPRSTAGGVERPLLDTWREDIVRGLRARGIPYREDSSNRDVGFERNWVRHVLLPLLEERYGKTIRKRLHVLGERFRELDEFLETSARSFLKRYSFAVSERVASSGRGGGLRIPRNAYSRRPAALRKKALQLVCFERLGIAPNERLLDAMDRLVVFGKPSARLRIGKGWGLAVRLDEAVFAAEGAASRPRGKAPGAGEPERGRPAEAVPMSGPGRYEVCWPHEGRRVIVWEERPPAAESKARRGARGERVAFFDAEALLTPLRVRPLRRGDTIRPFGLGKVKKVKELLIDRKVPRDERWGRPAVCDAAGEIVWVPGVLRSAHAPLTAATRRAAVLRLAFPRRRLSSQIGSVC